MSKFESLNDKQKSAVKTETGLLVSASAGSGKTTVLTERVMRIICPEEPNAESVDIDNLLIVTFTNNAAAEMRSRIERAIDEKLAEHPENKSLLRQKTKLANARICTIDSFCFDVVREHYDLLGIMPDFKVLEGAPLEMLQDKTAEDCFAAAYEAKNQEFFDLIFATSKKNNDYVLAKTVKDIHKKITNYPFYRDWLVKWRDYYKNSPDFYNTVWNENIKKIIIDLINDVKDSAKNLIDSRVFEDNGYTKYYSKAEQIYDDSSMLSNIALSGDMPSLLNAVQSIAVISNDNTKRCEAKDYLTVLINKNKNMLSSLGNLLLNNGKSLSERYKTTVKLTITFIDLLLDYDERLWQQMAETNALTFWAGEQLALKLLCKSEDKKIIPTELGREISADYYEVMVDEYQDVNHMQDALFTAVSLNGEKLFAVGDAKQSIYYFRGANPESFIKKNDDCTLNHILLETNYRSHKNICDYVNSVFVNLMTKSETGIEYKDEQLVSGIGGEGICVSVNGVIPTNNRSADEKAENEALAIAQYINKMMEEDKTLKYSDFNILLRKNKRADLYANKLIECGIPAVKQKVMFLNQREVDMALCLIRAVYNPTNDVAMLAVLLSPLFGLTADDIALLRKTYKANSIWGSVTLSKEEKFINIVNKFCEYRNLSVMLSLPEYLNRLFDESGLFYIARAMKNGKTRVENLYALERLGADYSKTIVGSANDFADYVESLKEEREIENTNENCVGITTMHKSKGLQYRVCIIAEISSTLGNTEICPVSADFDTGLGMDMLGATESADTVSPVNDVINAKNYLSEQAAELRLIYVAMTRAKEHLALFYTSKNVYDEVTAIKADLFVNKKISLDAGAKKPYYWLLASALYSENASAEQFDAISAGGAAQIANAYFTVTDAATLSVPDIIDGDETVNKEDFNQKADEQFEMLKESLSYEYPFEEETKAPSKQSVSELTHNIVKEYDYLSKPGFLSSAGLTPAQRGTATHTFMQFVDFNAAANDALSELERLREYRYLTDEQADAVDINKIKKFFASDIFDRILKAKSVKREMRFLVKADESKENSPILQGIADCVFEEPDGLVILDFKTDRVQTEQELKDMYKDQLLLYKKAAARILDKPVKSCIIYSFHLNCAIEVL